MTALFIDTTYDVTLGILDDDFKWIDFKHVVGQKSSIVLQKESWNLLTKHYIEPKKLTSIVTVAGPGFYTGLRLSEGFSDVFKFFNIDFCSFYTHEIPLWCGTKSGTWMTKAYRGEYFFHHWTEDSVKSELVATKDLESYLTRVDEVFIHSEGSLDAFSLGLIKKATSTHDLLKNHPGKIFKHVIPTKLKQESFYFRAPEDEFKANP